MLRLGSRADRTVRKSVLVSVIGAAVLLAACVTTERAKPVAPPVNEFSLERRQTMVGAVGSYVTREEDTLIDVARRYDLGFTQLVAANRGIDPWLPGASHRLVLPSRYILPAGPRRGVVINLVQQRLYYFSPDGRKVETHPIGVAVQGWSTPRGMTTVVAKQLHPAWYPPPSIRKEQPELPEMVPPGPDNPLGDYALRLGWAGYLIHGTNKPDGVGRNSSHGCIRLFPEDIEWLFSAVPVGTPVRVIQEEVQAAWIDDEFYVAVYPSKDQADQLQTGAPVTPRSPPGLRKRVAAAAGAGRLDRIDWHEVERAGRDRTGIPVRVTVPRVSSAGALY